MQLRASLTAADLIPPPATRRPDPPPGPYLVVGLGRAGYAAARTLCTIAGGEAVSAWDSGYSPGVQRVRARLEARGARTAGGDGLELLDADPPPRCVIKSPGIDPGVPLLAGAAARGLPVIDELELAWRLGEVPLVAVTGTNGKTTTTTLVQAVLRAAGLEAPLAGNTRLGPALSRAPEAEALVCEISSFQLEASPALLPEVALLTNLEPDHLSRHGDMETYGACKRRLFVRGSTAVPLAVLNADDRLGASLIAEVVERGGRAVTFGRGSGADYRLTGVEWTIETGSFAVETPAGAVKFETRLPGPHNALNATAALALAGALGIDLDLAVAAIGQTPGVPGRFELIEQGQPFDVVVDFATAPSAVAEVLVAARGVVERRDGRLLGLLSGSGHTTFDHRTDQARTARELTDWLVLTSERRTEDEPWFQPGLIEGAESAAGGELCVQCDRAAAIAQALEAARPGDAVVVMGRGAAQSQLMDGAGERSGFDDRAVAREALRGLGHRAAAGRRRSPDPS